MNSLLRLLGETTVYIEPRLHLEWRWNTNYLLATETCDIWLIGVKFLPRKECLMFLEVCNTSILKIVFSDFFLNYAKVISVFLILYMHLKVYKIIAWPDGIYGIISIFSVNVGLYMHDWQQCPTLWTCIIKYSTPAVFNPPVESFPLLFIYGPHTVQLMCQYRESLMYSELDLSCCLFDKYTFQRYNISTKYKAVETMNNILSRTGYCVALQQ